MRMLDFERKNSIWQLQLYLSPVEAKKLVTELNSLLENPEKPEHFHLFCENSGRELSCSIITKSKLSQIEQYTDLEQKILQEK